VRKSKPLLVLEHGAPQSTGELERSLSSRPFTCLREIDQ
jgi:hypothetical protein